ncbi:MAG: OmpW family protein [Methylophilaceae bacterium]
MQQKRLAVLLMSLLLPMTAFAEAGDWVVRARAVNVNPDEHSKLGSYTNSLLGAGAGSKLEVDGNTIPEFDISYYLTKNIALELVLAIGTRHDVKVNGANGVVDENLGSVNLLPPTLTAQWHFRPDQTFDPYLGAGFNYTRFMDSNLKSGASGNNLGDINVDRNSWGLAFQAGFDINLDGGWLINADVKKIWIDTDVKLANGTKIDHLDIDPWVIGIGFGKKF